MLGRWRGRLRRAEKSKSDRILYKKAIARHPEEENNKVERTGLGRGKRQKISVEETDVMYTLAAALKETGMVRTAVACEPLTLDSKHTEREL